LTVKPVCFYASWIRISHGSMWAFQEACQAAIGFQTG
jgi:hypothetical protein